MATISEYQTIASLKPGDTVDGQFLVTEKSLADLAQPSRSGARQFLRLQLTDLSGAIRAVVWENAVELSAQFSPGDVIAIKGEVGDYKGPQIVIRSLERLPLAQVDRRRFQRISSRAPEDMLRELHENVSRVDSNPWLSRLLQAFLGDREFTARFTHAPGGKSVHHCYVGGLLEHTLEVALLCHQFTQIHPRLDKPLLLCGALLHDIGKTEEYDAESLSFAQTDCGRLLGHIAIGVRLVEDQIRRIPDFPPMLRTCLTHMLLAHHGQKEWGAPEVPKTFEAFALHHADFASAKLNQFALVLDRAAENGWTEWDRILERNIFRGACQ